MRSTSFLLYDSRHHSTGTGFSFGDVIDQSDKACFMTEAERDNLNSTSEESCSSSAVRGEPSKFSLPNLTAKSRKHQNSFGSPEISYGGDKSFSQEKHSKTRSKILEQNNEGGSKKYKWPPNLSESKSAHGQNSFFQEIVGPSGTRLFDVEYNFADINSAETTHTSLGPKFWNEDMFSLSPVPDPFVDAKFSSSISEHASAVKFQPSGSFISGTCALCPSPCSIHSRGSPKVSKFDFGASKHEYSPDFPNFELEDRPPISSHDAVSCTEPFIPDLLAQQSVSKREGNKSKFPQDNHGKAETRKDTLVENKMAVSASDTEENGPGCNEEKDPTSETSSVKIPDRPQTNVDEKEYGHDAEVPIPKQKRNDETDNDGPAE